MQRIRILTDVEESAIETAQELRRQLEFLRDDPPGDQADRECLADALGHLTALQQCLDDIGKPDPCCARCGGEIADGAIWCDACSPGQG